MDSVSGGIDSASGGIDESNQTYHDPRFVREHRQWWAGTSGVVDMRPFGPGPNATAGKVFAYCTATIGRVVGTAGGPGTATFMVGAARDVFIQWETLVAFDALPFTHMLALHRTACRDGGEFLEAALINNLRFRPCFVNNARGDKGGNGNYGDYNSGLFLYVVAFRHPKASQALPRMPNKRTRSST